MYAHVHVVQCCPWVIFLLSQPSITLIYLIFPFTFTSSLISCRIGYNFPLLFQISRDTDSPRRPLTSGGIYASAEQQASIQDYLISQPIRRVELFRMDDPWFRDYVTRHPLVSPVDTGSTHKWLIHFTNGVMAIFKPQW